MKGGLSLIKRKGKHPIVMGEEETTTDILSAIKLVGNKILPKILNHFANLMNHVNEPQTLDQIIAVYSPLTSLIFLF